LAVTLRLFLLFSYAAQTGLEGLKALLGSKRALRRARIRTYLQVIRALAWSRAADLPPAAPNADTQNRGDGK
jgi:hypothetical protein